MSRLDCKNPIEYHEFHLKLAKVEERFSDQASKATRSHSSSLKLSLSHSKRGATARTGEADDTYWGDKQHVGRW